jgi:hypothetical protein
LELAACACVLVAGGWVVTCDARQRQRQFLLATGSAVGGADKEE